MKTIIALAIMMMPALAAAQINKCVDKSGKVVGYGNECPAGTRAEASGVKTAPAAPPAAGPAAASQPKSVAERDADFRKRQMEKQEAEAKTQKTSADAERRKAACADAQANLKSLQEGHRISRTDPKTGERSYLDDADYPKEIAKAQQQIQSTCK
jgi:hypothetical protein